MRKTKDRINDLILKGVGLRNIMSTLRVSFKDILEQIKKEEDGELQILEDQARSHLRGLHKAKRQR